jgi:hypothetical protein
MEAKKITSFRFGKSKIQVLLCTITAGTAAAFKQFRTDLDVDYEYCTGISVGFQHRNFTGLINDLSFENEYGTFVNPTIYNFFYKTLSALNKPDMFYNCFIPARGRRLTVNLNHTGIPALTLGTKFYVLLRLENEPAAPEFEYNLQQAQLTFPVGNYPGGTLITQDDNVYFDSSYNEILGFQSYNLTPTVGETGLPSSYFNTTIFDGDKLLLNACNDIFLESSITVPLYKGFFPLTLNCNDKTLKIRTEYKFYDGETEPGVGLNLYKTIIFLLRKPFVSLYQK